MRKLALTVLAAPLAFLAAPAGAAPQLPPTVVDPCVYGYPADPTVYADGTPAASLPCPLSVQEYGPQH